MWYGNLRAGLIPAGQAQVEEAFDECMKMVRELQMVRVEHGMQCTAFANSTAGVS